MSKEVHVENQNAAGDDSPRIDPTQLVVAEFSYIAETAFQANEDRARVSQFFFVTFATFIAALFSSQLDNVDTGQLYIAFAIVFLLVSTLGALTLLQLARLRQAWLESVLAMNQIKDQLVLKDQEIGGYFRWTNESLPPAFKVRSVGFILSITVSLISGLATGSAIGFYSLSRGNNIVPWLLCIGAGLGMSILQCALFYWLPLKNADSNRPPPG